MPDHRAEDNDHVADRSAVADAARPGRRRRVTTEPPPGSDPAPVPEPGRHAAPENDEQLKRDKPPHWG